MILLIEDDDAMRGLYAMALEAGGFEVLALPNAELGGEALRSRHIDLVLLDLKLSGAGTGLDFLRDVRRADRNIPVFMVTAFSLPQRESALRKLIDELGVEKYLVKPVDPWDLLQEVRNVLGRTHD